MTRKLHGSIRAATVVVVALLVTLAFTIPAAAVYDPAEDGDVQPDPNNPFPQVCGANVVLALDNSASLDRQNRTDLKNAANQTAAVLANSSAVSGLGIVEFNGKSGTTDDADTVIGITKLQSQSDVQTVQNAIATITAPDTETLTNWEAGLAEASQSANDEDGDVPNEDLNKPADIVILVSDGRPNAYGYNDTTVFDQSGALEAATKAANIVKSEGTRVIGVGFPGSDGNLPPENPFRQITNGSSSVTGAADDQANDYYIVDKSSDLSSVLTMIAEEFDCSVAVEKRNDANGDGTFTDEETAPEPNAPVEYQVEITNTGQISLTIDDYVDDIYGDVTLSQDIVGDVLAPGETRTVRFTGEAPGENGMKVNTFTVDASGSDGFQVSDSDTTTVNSPDLTPSITVDKQVDADGDGAFSDRETAGTLGQSVTYRVTVTNDGPNNVTIDSYSDNVYGSPTLNDSLVGQTLQPGESVTVTFEGSAPREEEATKTNTFTVTASDLDGDEATAEDTATVVAPDRTPSITVEKLVDADADGTFSDQETASELGGPVTYQITITNDGPNTVTIDDYSDSIYGTPALSPPLVGTTLQPGDSITVTFDGTAPSEEEATKTNRFTVTASDGDGDQASANDTATVVAPDLTPSITVSKVVDANGDGTFSDTEEASDTSINVTYLVTVTNDGPNNVTIDSYSDNIYGTPTLNQSLVGEVLPPGDVITVTFEGSAPGEPNASKTNVFSVTAVDGDGDAAADQDSATVTTPPEEFVCARTPGFWSTHNGDYATGNNPDLTTDLLPITLGDGGGESVVVGSDDDLNAIFEASLTEDSSKANMISKLYIHLLAAKLNVENGARLPAEVATAIDRSDELLTKYDESDWKDIKRNNKELANELESLKDTLDAYNNGAYDSESCTQDFWKDDSSSASIGINSSFTGALLGVPALG